MKIFAKFTPQLKINLDSNEKKEVDSFIERIFSDLRDEEKALMAKLQLHHSGTLTHSVMVAKDVEYIAVHMGIYSKDEIRALTIAALLHDSGKLRIHDTVLDLGGREELEPIWRYAHPNEKEIPQNLMNEITVSDLINYKKDFESKDKTQYIFNYLTWMKEKEVEDFLSQSLWMYIQYHQEGTRLELEKIGVSEELIKYAASHHPAYFTEDQRGKLPREIKIIEIADKFNAIMQTEGIRNYAGNKKTKTEAMLIIIETLKNLFKNPNIISNFFSTDFEGKIIEILAQEYFTKDEIYKEVFEKVKTAEEEFENIKKISRTKLVEKNEEFRKMLIKDIMEDEKLLALLIVISSFKNFDEDLISKVKAFDEELMDIVHKLIEIRQNEFFDYKLAA